MGIHVIGVEKSPDLMWDACWVARLDTHYYTEHPEYMKATNWLFENCFERYYTMGAAVAFHSEEDAKMFCLAFA